MAILKLKQQNFAPLEKAFDSIVTPFEEFVHKESTSGFLLMGFAFIAIVIANSPLHSLYENLLHIPVGINFGGWALEKNLHHWVNDGLMALFFFVVGLEIKREVLVGELSDRRQAALPVIAALGGMIVPALIYVVFNSGSENVIGWGIPMATDIAFVVGILVLLGKRVPAALMTFVVALAIVDDLGAVIVIALFYTDTIDLFMLSAAAAFFGLLYLSNLFGIRKPLWYFILGVLLWFALLKSGVHATLAGVLTALCIPARTQYDPDRFSVLVRELVGRFDQSYHPGEGILKNQVQRSILQTLENGVQMAHSPLQRLEHQMHMPVAFVIIPVFAFFNAGVPIDTSSLNTSLTHPVTVGVALGLVLGKFLGVGIISLIAIKLGFAKLPTNTNQAQLLGAAMLAGLGFTMSIFIADLAFAHDTAMMLNAKIGILIGSLIAGIGGSIILMLAYKEKSGSASRK